MDVNYKQLPHYICDKCLYWKFAFRRWADVAVASPFMIILFYGIHQFAITPWLVLDFHELGSDRRIHTNEGVAYFRDNVQRIGCNALTGILASRLLFMQG